MVIDGATTLQAPTIGPAAPPRTQRTSTWSRPRPSRRPIPRIGGSVLPSRFGLPGARISAGFRRLRLGDRNTLAVDETAIANGC